MNTTLLRQATTGRGKGYRVFPMLSVTYPWMREFSFKAVPGYVQIPVTQEDYTQIKTNNNGFFTRDKLKSEIRKVIASGRMA